MNHYRLALLNTDGSLTDKRGHYAVESDLCMMLRNGLVRAEGQRWCVLRSSISRNTGLFGGMSGGLEWSPEAVLMAEEKAGDWDLRIMGAQESAAPGTDSP